MKSSTQMALALAVGYVLGRRHKLRTAALLAGAAATGRLGSLGAAALKRGTKIAGSNGLLEKVTPQLGGIASTVRGELLEAGKAAGMAVVNNRIESLSDSLHQRTEALRAGSAQGESEDGRDEPEPSGGEGEPSGSEADDFDEPEDRAEPDEPSEEYEGEEEYGDEPEESYQADEDEEADLEYEEDNGDSDEAEAPQQRPDRRRRSPVTRAGR